MNEATAILPKMTQIGSWIDTASFMAMNELPHSIMARTRPQMGSTLL